MHLRSRSLIVDISLFLLCNLEGRLSDNFCEIGIMISFGSAYISFPLRNSVGLRVGGKKDNGSERAIHSPLLEATSPV
jgi:hypothetical protein